MERKRHFDVIVVGGGAAGFAAAIGAKKAGADVLLIERRACLGGQATNSNVASYCGFFTHEENEKQIVYGIGEELLQKLKSIGYYDHHSKSPVGNAIITLDMEATKLAFDLLAEDYKLPYLLHCRLIGVKKDPSGEIIESITCVDDEGTYEFSADAFVDATGDANLGFLAEAPFRYGDGNGNAYMSTRAVHMDHVPSSVVFKPALIEEAMLKAKADGFRKLTKESGIVFRLNEDSVIALLPSTAVPALDAETLTACEVNTRKQEFEYLEAFRKYYPGMENARIVSGGAVMGIRDTRHLLGEYTLTKEDVLDAVKQEDSIACGAWPCEMHSNVNKMASYIFIKDGDYYNIPLRSLKVKNLRNLWAAGRTISADPVAFASVRVMGIGFATGHAAGVAAALTKGTVPTASDVQKELLRQGAKIH